MAEARSKRILVSVEPSFFRILEREILSKENMDAAPYLRGLMLRDLAKRDLLTVDMILDVTADGVAV